MLVGLPTFQHFMTQVVFYAVTVPMALWLLVNWMLERVEQPAAEEAGGRSDPLAGLTRREMEVADLMARGCTNREIATELTVSPETVKTHVRHILRKLDMHDRGGVRELVMDSRWVLD